jgi:hypothetical protein
MTRTPQSPVLSVRLTKDGVWSVDERAASRIAIAYFPTRWGAMKHAVRIARTKRQCRVALVGIEGSVSMSREYRAGEPKEKP